MVNHLIFIQVIRQKIFMKQIKTFNYENNTNYSFNKVGNDNIGESVSNNENNTATKEFNYHKESDISHCIINNVIINYESFNKINYPKNNNKFHCY